jgi:hypothetical protein
MWPVLQKILRYFSQERTPSPGASCGCHDLDPAAATTFVDAPYGYFAGFSGFRRRRFCAIV